jgi:hypothetical protein
LIEPISLIRFFETHPILRYLPRLAWRLTVPKEQDQSLRTYAPERALSLEQTQAFIGEAIRSGRPTMIARFGNVELNVLVNYYLRREKSAFRQLNRYMNHRNVPFWTWRNSFRLSENAGFFPLRDEKVDAFCELVLDCLKDVDVLASWAESENLLIDEMSKASFCHLGDIDPFFAQTPWSAQLAGKRVVVVHPFAESIRNQYRDKRQALFSNPLVLPEFELLTVKAVQSIAGNNPGFETWFDALDHMKQELTSLDFDVAIIGCGAYGLPLASFVKRMGRVGVHLGAATQLLFGIRGRRWEEFAQWRDVFNDAWTRPLPSEVPQNHEKVESGCYW